MQHQQRPEILTAFLFRKIIQTEAINIDENPIKQNKSHFNHDLDKDVKLPKILEEKCKIQLIKKYFKIIIENLYRVVIGKRSSRRQLPRPRSKKK